MHHATNSRPLVDPQLNNMPWLLYDSREVSNKLRRYAQRWPRPGRMARVAS